MSNQINPYKTNELIQEQHAINAHEFLLKFLAKFDSAKRGGIHDIIEISLFNMVNAAIKNIDVYLQQGHASINGNEIMQIMLDSYQKVLDSMKRNLETMKTIHFN